MANNNNTRTFDDLLDRLKAQREAEDNGEVEATDENAAVPIKRTVNEDGSVSETVVDFDQPEVSDEDKPVVRLAEDILNDPELTPEEKLAAIKDTDEYTQTVAPEENDVEAVVVPAENDVEKRLG